MIHRRFCLLLFASAAACGGGDAPPDHTASPATYPNAVIEVAEVGFATPESVLHDTVADVYLVSNISGAPVAKDDDGFISRLSPEGQVEQLKWIDGTAANVTTKPPSSLKAMPVGWPSESPCWRCDVCPSGVKRQSASVPEEVKSALSPESVT